MNSIKTWNGYGTSKKKCIYCNKLTSDYLVFEHSTMKLDIYAHWECREGKDNKDEIIRQTLHYIKGNFK